MTSFTEAVPALLEVEADATATLEAVLAGRLRDRERGETEIPFVGGARGRAGAGRPRAARRGAPPRGPPRGGVGAEARAGRHRGRDPPPRRVRGRVRRQAHPPRAGAGRGHPRPPPRRGGREPRPAPRGGHGARRARRPPRRPPGPRDLVVRRRARGRAPRGARGGRLGPAAVARRAGVPDRAPRALARGVGGRRRRARGPRLGLRPGPRGGPHGPRRGGAALRAPRLRRAHARPRGRDDRRPGDARRRRGAGRGSAGDARRGAARRAPTPPCAPTSSRPGRSRTRSTPRALVGVLGVFRVVEQELAKAFGAALGGGACRVVAARVPRESSRKAPVHREVLATLAAAVPGFPEHRVTEVVDAVAEGKAPATTLAPPDVAVVLAVLGRRWPGNKAFGDRVLPLDPWTDDDVAGGGRRRRRPRGGPRRARRGPRPGPGLGRPLRDAPRSACSGGSRRRRAGLTHGESAPDPARSRTVPST